MSLSIIANREDARLARIQMDSAGDLTIVRLMATGRHHQFFQYIPRPASHEADNIARGRWFSIISRSAPSGFGFSAAVNASPKNAALTGSVDWLGIAADARPTAAERRILRS
jgi:hypothetical protein